MEERRENYYEKLILFIGVSVFLFVRSVDGSGAVNTLDAKLISLAVWLIFYLYYENTFLKITNYNIVNAKIPKDFHNYKIIQISDYHNDKSAKLNKDLISNIKNEKPNVIVITGDLIDSRKTNIEVATDLIKNIKEVAPIYYVTGNHELY